MSLVRRISSSFGRWSEISRFNLGTAFSVPDSISTVNGRSESSTAHENVSNGAQHSAQGPDLVTLEDIGQDDDEDTSFNTTRPINNSPPSPPATTTSPVSAQSDVDSDREITYEELKFQIPSPPKHIPFPDVPQNSELLNEFIIFAYTSLAASMQFLHLYRTVFWLAESHKSNALNFYLIDTSLVVFIVAILSRRFLYCLLTRIIYFVCPRFCVRFAVSITRFVFFFALLTFLGFCCDVICQRHGFGQMLYLIYPLPVYFITFRFRFEPFLRTTFESPKSTYLHGTPLHCCSTNPENVRAEIESLRGDYNNRLKQVVFTTILNAYYAGFIPCCFAQSFLFYDIYWATQHMAFMIFGGFTMCAMICFPANYCDVLHRSALHLGQWNRVEPSKYVIPARGWSKRVVWPNGMLVRYGGELFKATGLTTMAIPANAFHYRFYVFFQNPANIYSILSIAQATICVVQLMILYWVIEWHNVISLSFLLMSNYYTLFKVTREYCVTQKIYAAESSIYDKIVTADLGGRAGLNGWDYEVVADDW